MDPLKKVERRADSDARKMLGMMREHIIRVRGLIASAKNAQQARNREALYRSITQAYRELGGKMDETLKAGAENAATVSAKSVAQKLVDLGKGLVRFSKERAKRYWRYICPEGSRGLAATATDKMSSNLIDTLRRAMVEIERQAAIEGWPRDKIRRAIEDRWAELSKNDSNYKFVDKSGRAWENGRYVQMLARTTATRVYVDSYLDRLAEEGYNYFKISQLGAEPDCGVCRVWNGVICSIVGGGNYPTIEDARAAGVFHPNCQCTVEYVDELIDKDELERQGKAGKVDWKDPEAVGKRNKVNVDRNAAKADIAEQMASLGIDSTKETAAKPISGHPPPANPGWENLDYGHTNNCTRCVLAGYLRAQGYDVVARPLPENPDATDPSRPGQWASGMWIDAPTPNRGTKSDLLEAMKGYGDGAWAEVYVKWKGSVNAHVFLARQRNGKTEFIDPQSGNGSYDPWDRVMPDIQHIRIDTLKPREMAMFVETSGASR